MDNKNNIEQFDNLFKQSFEGASANVPPSVWEGVSSATTGAGAGASTGSILSKVLSFKGAALVVGTAAVISTAILLNKSNKDGEPVETVSTVVDDPSGSEEKSLTLVEDQPEGDGQTAEVSGVGSSKENTTETQGAFSVAETGHGNSNPESGVIPSPVADGRNEKSDQPDQGIKEDHVDVVPTFNLRASQDICCANFPVVVDLTSNVEIDQITWLLDGKELHQAGMALKTVLLMSESGKHIVEVRGKTKDGKPFSTNRTVDVKQADAGFKVIQEGLSLQLTATHPIAKNQWFVDQVQIDENKANVSFEGPDGTEHNIIHIVTDVYGCSDTVTRTASINAECNPQLGVIPNSFSPYLRDGKNDDFGIRVTQTANYRFTVFNSEGVVVFESDDQNLLWDGRAFNKGELLPAGMYIYSLVYGCDDNMKTLKGRVLLVE